MWVCAIAQGPLLYTKPPHAVSLDAVIFHVARLDAVTFSRGKDSRGKDSRGKQIGSAGNHKQRSDAETQLEIYKLAIGVNKCAYLCWRRTTSPKK